MRAEKHIEELYKTLRDSIIDLDTLHRKMLEVYDEEKVWTFGPDIILNKKDTSGKELDYALIKRTFDVVSRCLRERIDATIEQETKLLMQKWGCDD